MLTRHHRGRLRLRVVLAIVIVAGGMGLRLPPHALAASSYQVGPVSTILPSVPIQLLPLGTVTPQERLASAGRTTASFRPPPPHLRIPPRVISSGPVVPSGTMQTPTVSNPGYDGFTGLTARDDAESLPALAGYGSSGEPPDQGLCTGNGYILEVNNLVLAIYSAGSSHDLLSGPTNLAAFYGPANTNGLTLSDPRCLYDVPSGKWIVTLLVYTGGAAPACTPSTVGCKSSVYIAVSQTSDPRGAYNISKLDISDAGQANKPQCPCLGDQPYLGADANSVWITVNEFGPFSSFTTSYGAELYAIPKGQLLANPLGAIVVFPYSTSSGGADNDDSVQPAMVPGSIYDTTNGGTEYLMEAYASGTLRVFAATQTSRLSVGTPSAPSLTQKDVASQPFTTPPPMQQRTGAAPYQQTQSPATTDGGDSRLLQVTYAAGKLWSSNATGATSGTGPLVAANYYVVSPGSVPGTFSPSVVKQGTVSVGGENVSYPAVGVNDAGQAEMVVSIVGPDSSNRYAPYPSAGYVHLDANGASNTIHIFNTGAEPADGFTGLAASQGPPERWGDYSAANAAADGSIWFATEMIAGGPGVEDTNWSTTVGHIANPSASSSQTALSPSPRAQASTGQVGQTSATGTSCTLPPTNQSLCHPEQSATAPKTGNLWVADHANNRVLMFPNIGGAISPVATMVLGQPDFTSYLCNQGGGPTAATLCNPRGVAVDGAGNVWVSDTGNNRVLKYSFPVATKDQPASSVLGQPDMVSGAPDDSTGDSTVSSCTAAALISAPTACGLYSPAQIRFDPAGPNLYVADTFNNRALKYSAATLTTSCTSNCNLAASQVWCQPDFNSTAAPEPPTASSCNLPTGMAADGAGNVFIADTVNNRVLGFPAGSGNGQTATLVYGHTGSFSTPTPNDNGMGAAGSPTAANLNNPEGVALGPNGRLWIADFGNNRVLQFAAPTFSGSAASEAAIDELGQPGTANFTENGYNNQGPSASSLANPSDITFDLPGNGYLVDFGNNRLNQYTVLGSPTAARVARFAAIRDGAAVNFRWRLTGTRGILGFDLYAGHRRLNPHLIRATNRREYHYRVPGLRRGPFTLRLILANGRQVAIAAATEDQPGSSSTAQWAGSIAL